MAFNLNVQQNFFFKKKKIVENVAAEFEILFPLHKLRQTFSRKVSNSQTIDHCISDRLACTDHPLVCVIYKDYVKNH